MKTSVRLSKHVIPSRYQITMKPDLENFTFSGEENIKLQVAKPTKHLVLHSADLKIHAASWNQGKRSIDVAKIGLQPKQETVTLTFSENLSGSGNLTLIFEGELNEALRGFYRSAYDHNGQKRHIATTQFEATDARRAFPSFDEPAQKAVFEVSLVIPENLTAISNTIEETVKPHDPGYKVVKFTPTPKMSTYLLAFIVGDFESIQTKTKDGVTVRVFTTPGKTKQAKFALEVAKRSLEFMNEYFAIPYPLPVLDLIAIPDFAAGAMENWGAVTFRETALLVDEQHTPFINRERVAEVIAHELVHQWFGNLVTMEWWTHLWLNESFADYMSYVTIDNLFPEWHIWTKFVLNEHTEALHLDSLRSTHPIEVTVNHPTEISQIFDAISYSKGASVLRMLANYIGADKFRDGLRYYLKKHSYKNTSSIHLWEAFEMVSKKPVRKLMASWTNRPGYPVVTIEAKGNKVKVRQQRFQLWTTKDKSIWPIPIQAQIAKDKFSETYLLQKPHGGFVVSDKYEYLKLNAGEHGFYRSAYDPSLLAQALIAAREGKLSVIDRLGMMRDLFALAKAGYTTTDVYLEALQHRKDEDSYVIWAEVASNLAELHSLLGDGGQADQFKAMAKGLFTPLIAKLGWEPSKNESTSRSLLRAVAISNAGHYGDRSTITKAKALFNKHLKGGKIPPDLRMAVYSVVAKNGTAADWSSFQKLLGKATMHEEIIRLSFALVMFKQPALVKRTLSFLFSEQVRSQNLPFLLYAGMQQPETRPMYWQEIQRRWDDLQERFAKSSLLARIVAGTGHFTTAKDRGAVQKFFKTHRHAGAEQKAKQAIESINININWLRRDRVRITQYLKRAQG